MKKVILCILIGVFIFMAGIFLSTRYVLTGTSLGILGGVLMGFSSSFLPKTHKQKK